MQSKGAGQLDCTSRDILCVLCGKASADSKQDNLALPCSFNAKRLNLYTTGVGGGWESEVVGVSPFYVRFSSNAGNQNISLESVDGFARHGIRSRLASYGVCLLCCPRKHQTQTQTQTANVITLGCYIFSRLQKKHEKTFLV